MDNNINTIDNITRIHFIGIGGAGMYPMAKILKDKGYVISGSDACESENTKKIRSFGIETFIGHKRENVSGAQLVVYTAAVKNDNIELVTAKEKNIPAIERSKMLAILTSMYKNRIAVSGTHGKTTTTGMITQILTFSDIDPTAVIGGNLPLIDGNCRVGNSDVVVCEACEYVDSFLQLNPSVAVVLNVDIDHLDYFKNLQNIKRSFAKFAGKSGKTIVNGDDDNAMDAVIKTGKNIVTFGIKDTNDYYAANIRCDGTCQTFTLMDSSGKIADIELGVPGEHNIYNSLAAISTTLFMGADINSVKRALKEFRGVHRRFECLGKANGISVIDDFGHTPREIQATITTALNMNYNNVYVVFQPHTYSRTIAFLDDFAKVLSLPTKTVLAKIYASRETNGNGVCSEDLAQRIDGAECFDTFDEIADYIVGTTKPGDLVITIGAGDIFKCGKIILDKLTSPGL